MNFYREGDGPDHGEDFLSGNNVCYVVYCPRERERGARLPDTAYLRSIYITPEVSFYKTQQASGEASAVPDPGR